MCCKSCTEYDYAAISVAQKDSFPWVGTVTGPAQAAKLQTLWLLCTLFSVITATYFAAENVGIRHYHTETESLSCTPLQSRSSARV